jgi:transposase
MYDKETLEKKRHLARELFKKKTLNKKEIAQRLGVSWNFVHKWTGNNDNEIIDHRGWPLGKRRSHTEQEELRLIMIRR